MILKHAISSDGDYNWKTECGGVDDWEVKGIKELMAQLIELKQQIVTDPTLENKAMEGLITNRFPCQPGDGERQRLFGGSNSEQPQPIVEKRFCILIT